MANRDMGLYNFRFELLKALLDAGHDVTIFLPDGPKVQLMVEAGCRFIPMDIDKRGTNPFHDLDTMLHFRRVMRAVKPDVALLYTTKVCIYGGIVAARCHVPYLLNVSGLGTAVEQPGLIQKVTIGLYDQASRRADCVFFQSESNRRFFDEHHMSYGHYRMIPGSGVNLERWHALPYPDEKDGIHFLFIARLIREKGIEEYIAAAAEIRRRHPNCFFHILGPCDGNYEPLLKARQTDGTIIYHGQVPDTQAYLKWAHCTIHPSYYPEGISNVLLESAASCRPVITTDREGCKDTVDDGVSGLICKQRDVPSLVDCVERFLALTTEEHRAMGRAGREKVAREFDRKIVTAAYMEEIRKING